VDIDPLNPPGRDDAESSATANAQARRLNTWVAITVALLATFIGICKVKDDNLVQAMQQAQADKIDHWSFYQARNIRQEVAQAELDQAELLASTQSSAIRAQAEPIIARYRALVTDQKQKKEQLRVQAEADQKRYDELNLHDDQFDLADALTAIAISLLALTSLTQRRWLYWIALAASVLGVLMGLAGLLSWSLHPDALSRLLS
jgi:hypothetical protein